MIMRFFRILPLYAAALCLVAQTPPKPPAQATPIAPSTPASPTMTGPDGITLPLEIFQPNVIPPDRVVIQVGDLKLTAAQVDRILQAYPENQRVFVNGPGRNQFIDQVVRVLLLSEVGQRRAPNPTTWAAVPKAAISASSNAGRPCPLSRTLPSPCPPANSANR